MNRIVASSSSCPTVSSILPTVNGSSVLTVAMISTVTVFSEAICRKGFANCLVVRIVGLLKSFLTFSSSPTSVTSLLDKGDSIAGTPPAATADQNQIVLSRCVLKYRTTHLRGVTVSCARSLAALNFSVSNPDRNFVLLKSYLCFPQEIRIGQKVGFLIPSMVLEGNPVVRPQPCRTLQQFKKCLWIFAMFLHCRALIISSCRRNVRVYELGPV